MSRIDSNTTFSVMFGVGLGYLLVSALNAAQRKKNVATIEQSNAEDYRQPLAAGPPKERAQNSVTSTSVCSGGIFVLMGPAGGKTTTATMAKAAASTETMSSNTIVDIETILHFRRLLATGQQRAMLSDRKSHNINLDNDIDFIVMFFDCIVPLIWAARCSGKALLSNFVGMQSAELVGPYVAGLAQLPSPQWRSAAGNHSTPTVQQELAGGLVGYVEDPSQLDERIVERAAAYGRNQIKHMWYSHGSYSWHHAVHTLMLGVAAKHSVPLVKQNDLSKKLVDFAKAMAQQPPPLPSSPVPVAGGGNGKPQPPLPSTQPLLPSQQVLEHLRYFQYQQNDGTSCRDVSTKTLVEAQPKKWALFSTGSGSSTSSLRLGDLQNAKIQLTFDEIHSSALTDEALNILLPPGGAEDGQCGSKTDWGLMSIGAEFSVPGSMVSALNSAEHPHHHQSGYHIPVASTKEQLQQYRQYLFLRCDGNCYQCSTQHQTCSSEYCGESNHEACDRFHANNSGGSSSSSAKKGNEEDIPADKRAEYFEHRMSKCDHFIVVTKTHIVLTHFCRDRDPHSTNFSTPIVSRSYGSSLANGLCPHLYVPLNLFAKMGRLPPVSSQPHQVVPRRRHVVMIYTGSFAPFHKGHVEVLELARKQLLHEASISSSPSNVLEEEDIEAIVFPLPQLYEKEAFMKTLRPWVHRARAAHLLAEEKQHYHTHSLDEPNSDDAALMSSSWIHIDTAPACCGPCGNFSSSQSFSITDYIDNLYTRIRTLEERASQHIPASRLPSPVELVWVNGSDIQPHPAHFFLMKDYNIRMLIVPRKNDENSRQEGEDALSGSHNNNEHSSGTRRNLWKELKDRLENKDEDEGGNTGASSSTTMSFIDPALARTHLTICEDFKATLSISSTAIRRHMLQWHHKRASGLSGNPAVTALLGWYSYQLERHENLSAQHGDHHHLHQKRMKVVLSGKKRPVCLFTSEHARGSKGLPCPRNYTGAYVSSISGSDDEEEEEEETSSSGSAHSFC